MGQYFLITNDSKKEFLDPFEFPCSEKFPSILCNEFMSQALLWLTVDSKHSTWENLKQYHYSFKYVSSWSGDKYFMYGDYEQEEESSLIRTNYNNISIEVAAMLFEMRTGVSHLIENFDYSDSKLLKLFSKISLLESPPELVVKSFREKFGKSWKAFATKQVYS